MSWGGNRYHLMTGATGLMGHYLLKDAIANGVELAVVVRNNRRSRAKQRIEDSLARWESKLGRSLPRPVIFEGDLQKPNLGLSREDLGWVSRHCEAAIHNAASLTFVAKSPEDEPYPSNVGGTRNLLELCRETGIRKFHHVSTAYVCGLREGRILETESDVGQTMGNDYEKSKLAAEDLVRKADWLAERTCYRPGIVIGDSQSGYTSTFHGFYVPLKIATGLLSGIQLDAKVDLGALLSLFGMQGHFKKNFVPVDWVSAAMMSIIARPETHQTCYHLTPAKATQLIEMAAEMSDCVDAMAKTRGQDRSFTSLHGFQQGLESQMEVYRAYWRDDPDFDRTNTERACADMPCPEVNRAMLRRMCRYAIESGFGWPQPAPAIASLDVGDFLRERVESVEGESWSLGFFVSGAGGGQWRLMMKEHSLIGISDGPPEFSDDHVALNSETFRKLISGELRPEQAIRSAKMVYGGAQARSAVDALFDNWKLTL